EKYDLVQANAVKVFIVMCYTLFAVIIFAFSGKILWVHGLVLACGNSLGAFLGVKAAVKKGEKAVKIVLAIAIVIACLKLFGILKLFGL
ncbi:MAG: sulfite exporter TauE/SafE family protein, partial [Candidatus Cloacimonadales bacterium]|nr:sulfite exporter TauE/SafE family protein [Candidatus Cloacimonadales bacterium]